MTFIQTIDRLYEELKQHFTKRSVYTYHYAHVETITWSWVATTSFKLMNMYPTGLTYTTLLADLEVKWEFQSISLTGYYFNTIMDRCGTETLGDDFFLDCQIVEMTWKHDAIWLVTLRDSGNKEMDMYIPIQSNVLFERHNNTLSPFLYDFAGPHHRRRRIRFKCPPPINNPLRISEPIDLLRSEKILCCSPPKDYLWQLTVDDTPWIKDMFFKDTFATVIQPHSMVAHMQRQRPFQLWVKVIHVERDEFDHDLVQRKRRRHRRCDFQLIDRTGDVDDPALMCFYDDHADMPRLIQRGDYLGIYAPTIKEPGTNSQLEQTADLVFESGPNTLLFLMKCHDAMEAGLAIGDDIVKHEQRKKKSSSPMRDFFANGDLVDRDDDGVMDCILYSPRLYITDLAPSMKNVTLVGRVIAKANNNPFLGGEDGSKKLDRYAIRIQDETGQVDITLWDSNGAELAKQIMIGHRLVLTGLTTSVQQTSSEGNISWYVNGGATCGTMMYNVSELACLLLSDGIGQITPLHHILGDGQWMTEGMIVGWSLCGLDPTQPTIWSDKTLIPEYEEDLICISDYIVVQAHGECKEPIQEMKHCQYCDQQVSETSWEYRQRKQLGGDEFSIGWIEWQLDNGYGVLSTFGSEKTILGYRAQDFRQIPTRQQITLLNNVVGQEWICSMSCVGTRGYRFDIVVPGQEQDFTRSVSLLDNLIDV